MSPCLPGATKCASGSDPSAAGGGDSQPATAGTESSSRRSAGVPGSRAFVVGRGASVALLLAAFGLGALPVFLGIVNHDVAWILHEAGRVLAGDRLYVDLLEVNPPLIVWLNFAPIWLARAAGISEVFAFRLLVLLLVANSLLLAGWTMRRSLPDRPGGRLLVLLVALFALVPTAGYEFGQREHLMFALILPYLLMAAGRAAAVPMGRRIPWVVGTLAGFGIALKPHFLLLWAALEGYLACVGQGRRTWWRSEAISVAVVGQVYAIAVVTICPEYLSLVRWARSIYAVCNPVSFSSLLSHPAIFVSLIAWTGFSLVKPGGPYRECCRIALAANLGFLIIVLVQYKGYPYHYYPTFAAAMLLLGLLFVESRGLGSGRSRIGGVLCGGIAAALMVQASADRVFESLLWKGHPARSDTSFGRMVRLAKDHACGGSIFTFSASAAASFPLVTYSGAGWTSRHSCLWFLPALYAGYDGETDTIPYRPIEMMGRTERFLFDSVVEDLLRERQALLFVDETERKPAFVGRRFDYLRYFGRDPRFAALLREYEPFARVGAFRVYRHRGDVPLTLRRRAAQPG